MAWKIKARRRKGKKLKLTAYQLRHKRSLANRAKVGKQRVVTQRVVVPPQPEFRPITGYATDQPIPVIEKTITRYVKRPARWIPNGTRTKKVPCHDYLLHIPVPDWNVLCRAANAMVIPVSVIVRMAILRFVRQYKKEERFLIDGSTAGLVTQRRIFTRAEQAVLGEHSPHGAHAYRMEAEEKAIVDELKRKRLAEELELLKPLPAKGDVPESLRAKVAERTRLKRERERAELEARQQEIEAATQRFRAAQHAPHVPPPPPNRALSSRGRRMFIIPKKPGQT